MPTITIDLSDDACNQFAAFYGITDDCIDFMESKMLENVENVLIEKRNRDAIVAAQKKPLPSVTTDSTE